MDRVCALTAALAACGVLASCGQSGTDRAGEDAYAECPAVMPRAGEACERDCAGGKEICCGGVCVREWECRCVHGVYAECGKRVPECGTPTGLDTWGFDAS